MNTEKTYIMLKPDAIERKLMGEIIARIEKKGYAITNMKMFVLNKEILKEHYDRISAETAKRYKEGKRTETASHVAKKAPLPKKR